MLKNQAQLEEAESLGGKDATGIQGQDRHTAFEDSEMIRLFISGVDPTDEIVDRLLRQLSKEDVFGGTWTYSSEAVLTNRGEGLSSHQGISIEIFVESDSNHQGGSQ